MAKIKHNNVIEFNRIVAYGCSFTAGGELADHLLLPDKSIEEVDKIKSTMTVDQFNAIPEVKERGGGLGEHDEKGKTFAWPAKLGSKFNVPVLNRAIGGAGMQHIIYNIETDLANNVIDLQNDLIIVGITGDNRWFYINNNGEHKKPLMGFYTGEWPTILFYEEFITHISNRYNSLYHWFNAIKYLDMLSERLDGRLLQQPCLRKYEEGDTPDSLKNMLRQLDSFRSIIDKNTNMYTLMEDPKDTYAWSHPKEIYHQKFADHLAEILKYE